MCLETAWRVMSKCSATAVGVMAWVAIRAIMALRVGSAIAWNMSRFMMRVINVQLTGCKYMRNYLVAQNYLTNLFSMVSKWTITGWMLDNLGCLFVDFVRRPSERTVRVARRLRRRDGGLQADV